MASSDRIRNNFKTSVDLNGSREKRANVSVELRNTGREEALGKKRVDKKKGGYFFGVNQFGALVTNPEEMGISHEIIEDRTQKAIVQVGLAIFGGADNQKAHDHVLKTLVELFSCTDTGGDVAGRCIVIHNGMKAIKSCFYMKTVNADARICRCCLWIVQNVSSGGRAEVEHLIEQDFPSILFALLDHPSFDVRSDACTCIRNIVIESVVFRDNFVSMGILAKIEQQLDIDSATTDYLIVLSELLSKIVSRQCLALQPQFEHACALLFRLVESAELTIAMYAIDGLHEISKFGDTFCFNAISDKRAIIYPRLIKMLSPVTGERIEMVSCRRLVLKLMSNMVARQDSEVDAITLRGMQYTAYLKMVLEGCNDIISVKEVIYTLQNLTVGNIGQYIGDLLDNDIFRAVNNTKYRKTSTLQGSIAGFFAMALQYANDIQKVHILSNMALPTVIAGVLLKESQSECLSAIVDIHVWGQGWTSESEKLDNALDQEVYARLRQLLGYSATASIHINPIMTMIERLASTPNYDLRTHLLWLEENDKTAIGTWASELHRSLFEVSERIDTIGYDSMTAASANSGSAETSFAFSGPANHFVGAKNGRDYNDTDMKD